MVGGWAKEENKRDAYSMWFILAAYNECNAVQLM